jgi:hypothetical protein
MGSGCPSSECINVEFAQPISPTFNPIGPYEQNELPLDLPASSINEISGTWSPATISTETVGTQTYTFTPDPDQCANVLSYDITVNPLLDAEQFSTNAMLIYPNPASDQLTIKLLAGTTIKQIKLIDMLGRVLQSENFASTHHEEVVDLQEIARGNYLLEVILDNNQRQIKRITVK